MSALPPTFDALAAPAMPGWQEQYNRVKLAEAAYDETLAIAPSDKNTLENNRMFVRVLGFLMLHLPRAEGVEHIAESVRRCQSNEDIVILGRFFLKTFIVPLKQIDPSSTCLLPEPEEDSDSEEVDISYAELTTESMSHATARKWALTRDNHRCLITSNIDPTAPELAAGYATAIVSPTRSSNIIPEALNNITIPTDQTVQQLLGLGRFISGGDNEAHQTVSAYTVFQMFGFADVQNELAGNGIHRLENILTLEPVAHIYLDALDLWLEPTSTGTPNEYHVRVSKPYFAREHAVDRRPVTTVILRGDVDLPPPSPDYIALRAACCRVAHASGAAAYLERAWSEYDEVRTDAQYLASPRHVDALVNALSAGLLSLNEHE